VLKSLQGTDIHISFEYNANFINSARVLASDLMIGNGVMHVIDNVLAPNLTTAQPNPTTYTQDPVLPTAGGDQSFNSSAAPYTTFLPGMVVTESSTAANSTTGAAGLGAGGSMTGSSTSTAATSTKKSAAGSTRASTYGGGVVAMSWIALGLVSAGFAWAL
jgi:transforming growth factor-beta-induced protein